jgi:DoxX-like family
MESEPNGARRPLIGTVATLLFSLAMTGSALLFLSGGPQVAETLAALGYPAYVAKMLGVAKLLGVAALWLPVPRTLREWAYAGFVFNLAGAVVSHLASAGPRAHALQPALLLVPLLLSYGLRHRGACVGRRAAVVGATMEAWR